MRRSSSVSSLYVVSPAVMPAAGGALINKTLQKREEMSHLLFSACRKSENASPNSACHLLCIKKKHI